MSEPMTTAEIVDLIRTGFIPPDKLDEGNVLVSALNEAMEDLRRGIDSVQGINTQQAATISTLQEEVARAHRASDSTRG